MWSQIGQTKFSDTGTFKIYIFDVLNHKFPLDQPQTKYKKEDSVNRVLIHWLMMIKNKKLKYKSSNNFLKYRVYGE